MTRQVLILAERYRMPPSEIRERFTSADLTEIIAHNNTHLPIEWYMAAWIICPLFNGITGAKTVVKDWVPKLKPDPEMSVAQMKANLASWR